MSLICKLFVTIAVIPGLFAHLSKASLCTAQKDGPVLLRLHCAAHQSTPLHHSEDGPALLILRVV